MKLLNNEKRGGGESLFFKIFGIYLHPQSCKSVRNGNACRYEK